MIRRTVKSNKAMRFFPLQGVDPTWRHDDSQALQSHINAVHNGKVDQDCPACKEIQERYGAK